jgi:hypothetical protein
MAAPVVPFLREKANELLMTNSHRLLPTTVAEALATVKTKGRAWLANQFQAALRDTALRKSGRVL